MAPPLKDLTGKRFGRLTVVRRAGTYHAPSGPTAPVWECRCDCGNVVNVVRPCLTSGNTREWHKIHDNPELLEGER